MFCPHCVWGEGSFQEFRVFTLTSGTTWKSSFCWASAAPFDQDEVPYLHVILWEEVSRTHHVTRPKWHSEGSLTSLKNKWGYAKAYRLSPPVLNSSVSEIRRECCPSDHHPPYSWVLLSSILLPRALILLSVSWIKGLWGKFHVSTNSWAMFALQCYREWVPVPGVMRDGEALV